MEPASTITQRLTLTEYIEVLTEKPDVVAIVIVNVSLVTDGDEGVLFTLSHHFHFDLVVVFIVLYTMTFHN